MNSDVVWCGWVGLKYPFVESPIIDAGIQGIERQRARESTPLDPALGEVK